MLAHGKNVTGRHWGLLALFLVAACGDGGAKEGTSSPLPSAIAAPPQSENPDAKVSPDAAFLIEGEGWEKTRREWGSTWIARINKAMPLAAQKAAESATCDYVEVAGLSDRSIPRSEVVFYVDCKNGERFYISEADATSNQVATSKGAQTAAVSNFDAIQGCEQSVKAALNHPQTFKRHRLDTSVYRAPGGNVVVEFGFDAKNGLGTKLPQHARCVIDDRGMSPAEISAQ